MVIFNKEVPDWLEFILFLCVLPLGLVVLVLDALIFSRVKKQEYAAGIKNIELEN